MIIQSIVVAIILFVAICVFCVGENIYLAIFLMYSVFSGYCSQKISYAKKIDSCFYLGLFFGILGVITACGLPDKSNKS